MRKLFFLLIGLFTVGTVEAQTSPTHITVLATNYTFRNDSLGLGISFQINDSDLDSLYIAGPFNHAVLATAPSGSGVIFPPFTIPQTVTLWYDVSAMADSQTVSGDLFSRTYRGLCRSGTINCSGNLTGPLRIPFTWTKLAVLPPQQTPPEDITLWYNANSNIIVNQVMDKDIKPSPIAMCDSLRAQYIYNRPLSFGLTDTINIVLLTTNTQGCTMFVPRTRHTLWMFKRYVFDNFNGNTALPFPGSPAVILMNEIP